MDLTYPIPTLEEAHGWYTQLDAAHHDAAHHDAAHDFDHIIRVYHLAQRLGLAEGADLTIVKAAALLHDVRGSMPGGEQRAEHHLLSAIFAGEVLTQKGWSEEAVRRVQHCIRAHRFRDESEQPGTIEAKVIYDADKLDVLGAVGVIRTVAYSVLAGEPVYAEPSEKFLRSGEKIPGEPHSSYHEYLFKLSRIKDRLMTASGKKLAESRHAYMAGFFQRLRQEMEGEL